MKFAEGPRPITIHGFALGFVFLGAFDLVTGLSSIEENLEVLRFDLPWVDWDRDRVIIFESALFSITLIPVVAIWCFASRIARGIVLVMGVFSLMSLIIAVLFVWRNGGDTWWAALAPLLVLSCVGLLFLPSSNWWLRKEELDLETFC